LIEWLVAVERTDEIVAIRPDVAAVIEVQSVGISIASVVEPVSRPVFPKGGFREETINQMFIGLR